MAETHDIAALRRDWTTLGEVDPLWAVYVDPVKRGGRWQVEEFLATGRQEVGVAITELDRLGLAARRESALDFGCGVGRLTATLSGHYEAVTGVDVSPSMLEHARRIHAANDRCHFVYNDQPDLSQFADDTFDLAYSSLVLQHLTPGLSDGYVRELVRVVRPGGAVVLIVPERHLRTPRGLVYAYAPPSLISWMQQSVFGYPAPMRMQNVPAGRISSLVKPLGAQLVRSQPRPWPGHWLMVAHYIRVDAAGRLTG
jgi:SAM-dependent methyltransferase